MGGNWRVNILTQFCLLTFLLNSARWALNFDVEEFAYRRGYFQAALHFECLRNGFQGLCRPRRNAKI